MGEQMGGWEPPVLEDVETVQPLDTYPKSGVWADDHPAVTEDEAELGNQMGETIDIDDPDDNGGMPVAVGERLPDVIEEAP